MRFKNELQDLKLYAVSGTKTVLLSIDIDKEKLVKDIFLGFSIERKDKNGKIKILNGTKKFPSLKDNPNEDIRNKSFIQSFYWQDYTVEPGEQYEYTVKANFGTPSNPQTKLISKIIVITENLHSGKHSVFFNYGVTGSQAYAKNKEFGNTPISKLSGKPLQDALNFLGRDLYLEGLIKFIQQAENENFELYGAFYEFQYNGYLNEIKKAKDRGVKINLIISGKEEQYEDHIDKRTKILKYGNKYMIEKSGLKSCIKTLRTKPNQPHNKFLILCKNGKPIQVWTGSTNITIAGIFGHSNTGHWIVDDEISSKYLSYWNALMGDPTMSKLAKICENIQPDCDLTTLEKGEYVFFSPRDISKTKPSIALQNYADLINSAKELVCMIFPFNIDDVFSKVYSNDVDFLRLLIFESTTEASKVKSNDKDLKITAGNVFKGKEKYWSKEVTTKTITNAGILYVHNKFFLIDALTDNPIILTGSANFSNSSIRNNDENSILIKGDLRVADIYLTEFDRLFTHFWPRYLSSLKLDNKYSKGFEELLNEKGTWYNDYFDKNKFRQKRKVLFKNMYGAKTIN